MNIPHAQGPMQKDRDTFILLVSRVSKWAKDNIFDILSGFQMVEW